jgi:DNA polymerase-3 subunit alpha
VKNVGIRAIELIVAEREANGSYQTLLDMCLRVDLHEVNKRVVEALIKCGSMDALGERAQLLASLDRIADRAQDIQRERESGQVSMFGDGSLGDNFEVQLVEGVAPADDRARLQWEREFLGIYLSDHPLRRVEADMSRRTDTRCVEIAPDLEGFEVRVGGIVREVRRRPDRSGRTMAFLELEDLTGSVGVTVFSRTLEQVTDLLQPDRIVLVAGRVDTRRRQRDGGEGESAGLVADQVWGFDDPDPEGWARLQVVHLTLTGGLPDEAFRRLDAAMEQFPGPDQVMLHVEGGEQAWDMELPRRVTPGDELRAAVESVLGPGSYRADVVRRRATERKPWLPRSGPRAQDEVA